MEDIEDSEFVASEHDRLVSAVSKLDKTQHITAPTRSEPTITNSEFNLIKRSNKLNLNDVAKVLEETSNLRQISKKLKKSHDASKVLPKPLEKPQADRIKRATGYEETKKKVGRWDPVVARSRTEEYTVFPIKHVETKLQPTNEFLARFELKSQLERELEEVDPPLIIEQEEDEEKIYPMSYEEMVEHRQHSAKLRAQQSYKQAKAKRQSKIKSKKYHRVLKKERLKLQLKEFEELQKTNPEEALKKLESIEKARALERHTLRHKNTGKWAKNKMIRAKYDKDVRQQLAEQLAVSRSLTKKTQDVESSDDDAGDNEGIPDVALAQDPLNPWMLKQSNKSNVNAEFDFGYKKYLKDKMFKRKDDSGSDSDEEEEKHKIDEGDNPASSELSILKQSIKKIAEKSNDSDEDKNDTDNDHSSDINKNILADLNNKTAQSSEQLSEINIVEENTKRQKQHKQTNRINISSQKTINRDKSKKLKLNKTVATSRWVVEQIESNTEEKKPKPSVDVSSAFESLESTVAGKVEEKLKALRQQLERIEKSSRNTKINKKDIHKDNSEIDNLEYLSFKNKRQRPVIDEALIETGSKAVDEKQIDDITAQSKILNATAQKSQESGGTDIDPSRFIEVKPKYLNTAVSSGENEVDLLDDDEQVVPRVNIEEVFEEDDVVASFRQEKEDEINKDKPEDIDLSLPGWGSWGGKGVKAPKRKKSRLILKGAPKMPRRDENKGDIIIKEYKDPKLAIHKVKEIPFPFNSVRDFESSIRAPLGNTFIPEKAHKKLIRPSVITKAGAIIEPMDEDELLVKKNRNFMNENILKILGQK